MEPKTNGQKAHSNKKAGTCGIRLFRHSGAVGRLQFPSVMNFGLFCLPPVQLATTAPSEGGRVGAQEYARANWRMTAKVIRRGAAADVWRPR